MPAALGQDPDLEEVHGLGLRGVELAVAHAGAGAHALDVARPDDRAGAHAVLVLERALEHVGDDLHVAVRVGAEPAARRDAIFVDHAQRAEAHVRRIVVVGERERVVRCRASRGRRAHDPRPCERSTCSGTSLRIVDAAKSALVSGARPPRIHTGEERRPLQRGPSFRLWAATGGAGSRCMEPSGGCWRSC